MSLMLRSITSAAAAIALVTSLILAGCGQKGDLFLPDHKEQSEEQSEESSSTG